MSYFPVECDSATGAVVIEPNSRAFYQLWEIMHDPGTYKVSIDIRADGVALKRNEGMWSPTLRVGVENK